MQPPSLFTFLQFVTSSLSLNSQTLSSTSSSSPFLLTRDIKCSLKKNFSTFKLLVSVRSLHLRLDLYPFFVLFLHFHWHIDKDSSLSMAKSTYLCQKFVCVLKPHVHVSKHILIDQNYSIWILKRFNQFKTLLWDF